MHAISTVALLTTLAAGVLAQGIGSFDTFTDRACDEGGHGITVPDENAHGTLPREVLSVKSYLPGCSRKRLPPPPRPSVVKRADELTFELESRHLGSRWRLVPDGHPPRQQQLCRFYWVRSELEYCLSLVACTFTVGKGLVVEDGTAGLARGGSNE